MVRVVESPSAPRPGSGERRQLSVLFTDLADFTAMVERIGEDRAPQFAQAVYRRMSEAILRNGGTVRGFAGDSVMGLFGVPEAQEDPAFAACTAALGVIASFAEAGDAFEAGFGVRPDVRVGVSSGSAVMAVVEGDGHEVTAVGNTVNLASRIESLAPTGGCLVCDATRRLVEGRADLSYHDERVIKGLSRPRKLWRLHAVRAGASRFDASRARGLSAFVGRAGEVARMTGALAAAGTASSVIDVVAEPGLGKTRLVYEFLERLRREDTSVLIGHCARDGAHTPFYPFLEVVRSAFGIEEEDETEVIVEKLGQGLRADGRERRQDIGLLLNLLGLPPPPGALDGLDGVLIGLRTRDLLGALLRVRCAAGPVVLLLEDIHWIDPASEAMLGALAGDLPPAGLLAILTRRPEYRPDWIEAATLERIALAPLGSEEIAQLARSRLGIEDLPGPLLASLVDRSAGNPLFGEEILTFLMEQGALTVAGGRVTIDAPLEDSGLPASMQSLLAARIDRFGGADRRVLQAASAIGRRFDPSLLASVTGREADIGEVLRRLQAHDIIHPEQGANDYAFKHVLMRDTIYRSLLEEDRAALHLAIATALETRSANRLPEEADRLAYHYALTDRADKAFRFNALAGRKSLGTFSLDAAERYFVAALERYDSDPACADADQVAACLADLAQCLNISMRPLRMIEIRDRYAPVLDRMGDRHEHVLFLHHYIACLVSNSRFPTALSVLSQITAMAERLGDARSRAYALASDVAVRGFVEPMPAPLFERKRAEGEALVETMDDAYLRNYFAAFACWTQVCSGRMTEAEETIRRMIVRGHETNDARALGYGNAVGALVQMLGGDYAKALEEAELALEVSRAEFDRANALTAKYCTLVALERPGALDRLQDYIRYCSERGWHIMQNGPEGFLGLGLAMQGRIGEGIAQLRGAVARREAEGNGNAARWSGMFLCEIYLSILGGEQKAPLSVTLRNLRSILKVLLFGEREIRAIVAAVHADPLFDPEGYYIARAETILGRLHLVKGRKTEARRHLEAARRIAARFGNTPMLAQIDACLGAVEA
jgi:class 3 adenylate cyclase/tetratricopeptide (TPR) repeat protein